MIKPAPLGKLVELDSLRGLMALWVYASHVLFMAGMGGGRLRLLANGGPAVTVFMMLSGFAIASSLIHTEATYGQYMARRGARIYPIYILGLLLGAATSAGYPKLLSATGFPIAATVSRLSARVASEHDQFWLHMVSHLALVHGMIPDRLLTGSALSFNGPAWSLSLEMQFYVVAPLLVLTLRDPMQNMRSLFIVTLVAMGGILIAPFYPDVPSFLPIMIGWFVIGISTAVSLPTLKEKPASLLLAASVVLALASASRDFSIVFPIFVWVVVILACSLDRYPVFAAARRALLFKPAILFGECSYGFYIIHMPILIIWGEWLNRQGFAQKAGVYALLLIVTFPVTSMLAYLSFRFLEGPINQWAKTRFGGAALRPISRNFQM